MTLITLHQYLDDPSLYSSFYLYYREKAVTSIERISRGYAHICCDKQYMGAIPMCSRLRIKSKEKTS